MGSAIVVNNGSTAVGGPKMEGFDAVTLEPGNNKVDEKWLEKAMQHRIFKAHFDEDVQLTHPVTGHNVAKGKRLSLAGKVEAPAPAAKAPAGGKGKDQEK